MSKTSRRRLAARRRGPTISWWPYAILGGVLVAVGAFVLTMRTGSVVPAVAGTPSQTSGERGLPVGAQAPDFGLGATTGGTISLGQLKGSKVVLYFYEGSG